MTDDTGTTSDGGGQAPDLAELKARQDTLDGKLDQILSILGKDKGSGPAPAGTGETAAPTSVADEIRAQLEERDRKAAADQDKAGHDEWKTSVDKRLAELAEKPPESPVRRAEKIMGWR
jgi:hypothetical protein